MSISISWVFTLWQLRTAPSLPATVYHTIKVNGLPSTVSSMSLHYTFYFWWGRRGGSCRLIVITKLNRRRACNAWVGLICSVLMASSLDREGNNGVSDGGEVVACGSQARLKINGSTKEEKSRHLMAAQSEEGR